MKTVDEFIANAKQLIGHPYIYGGNYSSSDIVDRSHLLSVKKQYPKEMTTAKITSLIANFNGQIGCDCSGTITHSLGLPKIRSANLWEECTKKGLIANIPNIPGLIVYRIGHIGIYLGNGDVLENGSTQYGCKITNIHDPITGKAWTGYGYLDKYIEYSDAVVSSPSLECPYSEPVLDHKPIARFDGNDAFWFEWQMHRIGYSYERMGCKDDKLDGVVGSKMWGMLIFEMKQCGQSYANKRFRQYLVSVPSK